MAAQIEHKITAYMKGTDGDNADNIHTDVGAKKMGYEGGLVYGTTVYAWATPFIVDSLGASWLASGWADFFVRRPIYVGDLLSIQLEQTDRETFSLQALGEDGKARIDGSVGLGNCPSLTDHVRSNRLDIEPLPSPQPRITLDTAPIGKDLPRLQAQANDRFEAMFTEATEHERGELTYKGRHILAPAAITGRMTWYVHAVWDYGGPALHTRSQVQHLDVANFGEALSVAGHFKDAFDKNGHHHSTTDGIVFGADGREVALTRHGSIFKVAPRQ